jgi:hypothetical protein
MRKMDSGLNNSHWLVKWRDEISVMNPCRSHLFIVEEVKGMDVICRAIWRHQRNLIHFLLGFENHWI